MITNTFDPQVLESLLKTYNQLRLRVKSFPKNDQPHPEKENLDKVCEFLKKASEKQPVGEESTTITTVRESCTFFLREIPSTRLKITLLDRVVEYFKSGSKLPKELKPRIEMMEHYLEKSEESMKKINTEIAYVVEVVSIRSLSAQSTRSFKFSANASM